MSEKCLMFIHALTSLHPGSGTALGVVDMPVQRERHTDWPTIPGSSLKGILRDACRRKSQNGDSDNDLCAVFGPPTHDADAHAGALSITDARILAFPVRSLRGVFAWVTCPAVLSRLQRDLNLAGIDHFEDVAAPAKDHVLCRNDSPLLIDGNKMILEEFAFTQDQTGTIDELSNWIGERVTADEGTKNRIKQNLAVLHEDDFTHFVRHATEVVARVGLEPETKTAKTGALFYEEFLPTETLFYSVILADDSRREKHEKKAKQILEYVRDNVPPVLQIGADETIGKGLCAIRIWNGKEESDHGKADS